MRKKILNLALILILVSAMLILTGCGEEENLSVIDNTEVQEIDNETQDENCEIINLFNEYMLEEDFESAAQLFDIDGFQNFNDVSCDEDGLAEVLEVFYDEFGEMFLNVGEISKVENLGDYKDYLMEHIFNNFANDEEMTEDEIIEEYLKDYLLYSVEYELDGESQIEIFFFSNENKFVSTGEISNILISAPNDVLEMSENASKELNYSEVESMLSTVVAGVSTNFLAEYVYDSSIKFVEYCDSEKLNELAGSNYAIKLGSWDDDGTADGTITYNDETYEFTLELYASGLGASVVFEEE